MIIEEMMATLKWAYGPTRGSSLFLLGDAEGVLELGERAERQAERLALGSQLGRLAASVGSSSRPLRVVVRHANCGAGAGRHAGVAPLPRGARQPRPQTPGRSLMRKLLHALPASVVLALATLPAAAQGGKIVMEEFMVPASDAGIEIFVRNKRPANMTAFRPERTCCSCTARPIRRMTAFDLKLGGQSWMDYIAARGYDVYLLDLRGYGKSTRPKEMAEHARSQSADRRAATPRSRTSAPPSISSSRAATSRASTCSAGRGARR